MSLNLSRFLRATKEGGKEWENGSVTFMLLLLFACMISSLSKNRYLWLNHCMRRYPSRVSLLYLSLIEYPDHWLPLAASFSPWNSSLLPHRTFHVCASAFSVAFGDLWKPPLCYSSSCDLLWAAFTLLLCSTTLLYAEKSLHTILHPRPLPTPTSPGQPHPGPSVLASFWLGSVS